ncbi:GNAT family N-acetyltransferase [Profundibacter sp.]|uniref:GNAT family N-acetyltransferase n=1 Tax=Profundibacter sp. TaxID=3101071 RepID=UPI003D110AFC
MGKDTILGPKLKNWMPPPCPTAPVLEGRYARLERLDADRHADELHRANAADDTLWDYMAHGPFLSALAYSNWVHTAVAVNDPYYYAIKNLETGQYEGVASYLRIRPEMGDIEVGSIVFTPPLQRTRAATEAMFLMMQWAFEVGYRRYEWKCDALNQPSRRAALRLGFTFEGIFRQHMVIKGRNRDTAWFSVIDSEWPALKTAFETWLSSENFSTNGQQRQSLSDLTRRVREADTACP